MHSQEDEEQLLKSKPNYVPPRRNRLFSPCGVVLMVIGTLVLLTLGFGAGLLAVSRIAALRHRIVPLQNSTAIGTNLTRLGVLPPIVLPRLFGTNISNDLVGPNQTPSGFSLTGTDFTAALNDPNVEPALPKFVLAEDPKKQEPVCSYTHKSFLAIGGPAPPLADFRRVSGRLEIDDVRQGAIGDCGFVASVVSLIANGQQADLARVLETTPDTGQLRARFQVLANLNLLPNTPASPALRSISVKITDRIATVVEGSSDANCATYIGASPGFDASTGSPRPIVFMPLLEKAWAKFMDANPQFRDPTILDTGYKGITGTAARFALQSISGGLGRLYERKQPGPVLDLVMANFLLQCLNLRRACVVGAPPQSDERLGIKNGRVETAAGVLTADAGGATHTLEEAGTGRKITIVGTHYYAMEGSQFVDGQFFTFDNVDVTLHNPWSCNPTADSKGFCAAERSFTVRLKSIPFLFTGVEWADPTLFTP